MTSWHSYPSIYNLGHKAVQDLLHYPVLVEEKVDGSQFSFGKFEVAAVDPGSENPIEGVFDLKFKSKGAGIEPAIPPKMFKRAVDHIKSIADKLHPGWTYRGECLDKPKHNTLAYERVPAGHVIIFDINSGEEEYLSYDEKAAEAARVGLEVVPRLFYGTVDNIEQFRGFLERVSCLGGPTIEGVVVKQLGPTFLYGPDHKQLIGKFVSERFKEAHIKAWGESNPSSGDIIQRLTEQYRHPGRWLKAIQHLRDAGQLEDSPRDIGKLLIEIQKDTGTEEKDAIKQALWKWAWPHISRGIHRGFPEFYKNYLLNKQFEAEGALGEPETPSESTDVSTVSDLPVDELVHHDLER